MYWWYVWCSKEPCFEENCKPSFSNVCHLKDARPYCLPIHCPFSTRSHLSKFYVVIGPSVDIFTSSVVWSVLTFMFLFICQTFEPLNPQTPVTACHSMTLQVNITYLFIDQGLPHRAVWSSICLTIDYTLALHPSSFSSHFNSSTSKLDRFTYPPSSIPPSFCQSYLHDRGSEMGSLSVIQSDG